MFLCRKVSNARCRSVFFLFSLSRSFLFFHIMRKDWTHTHTYMQSLPDNVGETKQLLRSTTMAFQISLGNECHYSWSFFLTSICLDHISIKFSKARMCSVFLRNKERKKKKPEEKKNRTKKRRRRRI